VKLLLERFEERTVPSFLPTSYVAGAGPASVTTADFQGLGNGNADFAVANIGANTVSVFLNNNDGSGTFHAPVNYTVAGSPVDIAAGDLTGDGLPDIVVTDASSNTVTILYNDPAHPGTFQPRVGLLATGGAGPRDVRLADLTGDGDLDIIVANSGNNTVGVLLNHGDGTFDPAHTYAAGAPSGGAYALAVADFYGDGFPSIAVSNPGNPITLLRGNGDGTFQAFRNGPSPGLVTGLAAGDLGNGHVDLVSANNNTGGVTVLLNDGNGNFTSHNYATGPTPLRVRLGDVNGDGNLDIVTDNFLSMSPGTISILYGNGDGTFQAAQNVSTGGDHPSAVAIADVEGDFAVDHLNDIIVPNNVTGNVTVLIHSLAPVVESTTLTGEFNNQMVSEGDVVFSDPIDPNTFVFDYDEFSLTDPSGHPVRVNSITATDGTNRRFHVTFAPQSAVGTYMLTIGPDIYDVTDRYRMPAAYHGSFSITSNLIVNGGFETGDFPPWVQSGDTSFTAVLDRTVIPVHSGNYALESGPTGSLGYISQTVTTMPGQMYRLSLWLDHPYNDPGTEFQVQIGGTTVDDQFNPNLPMYTQFTYNYMATGTSTTIRLGFFEPPAYFYLDDVSFSATGGTVSSSGQSSSAGTLVSSNFVSSNTTNVLVKGQTAAAVGSSTLQAISVEAQQTSVATTANAPPANESRDRAASATPNSEPAALDRVVQLSSGTYHMPPANVELSDSLVDDVFQSLV
jgi:hypothetical protein